MLPLFWLLPSALAAQPSAPEPISAPLRALDFGQLNFLHTTDTHGWLAGHLQESSYSADWGDYVSFATRMREKAEARGQDLLVIDTGDRVEGNGLYDSSEPKGIYLSDILRYQHIDLLTSGNHELYKQNTSEAELLTTVPNFRGNYIASNIDIFHPTTHELVPLAPRYKKFTTNKQGIRIVAFGFLFDFTGNYNNTVVQPVEETIKEDWFQEAIRDKEVDLFLVIGHVPAHSPEYRAIFKAIRGIRWDTPIQFFGGHQHVRDYAKYDDKAFALASGRFMETIGFMSIDGLATGGKSGILNSGPVFKRRYIDSNLYSYHYHTGLDQDTFPTEKGQNVSRLIAKARSELELDKLWMSRVKYPDDASIFTWLGTQVIPDSLRDDSRAGVPALAIVNTGAMRFDIFKGPFTQDSAFIVSPFTSGFRYLKNVPYDKAQLMLEVLNKQPQVLHASQHGGESSRTTLAPPEQLAYLEDVVVDQTWPLFSGSGPDQISLSDDKPAKPLVPGYTTKDDAGTDGDDTIHAPISFYRVPNCIQALVSANSSEIPEKVDLVYIDFIERYMVLAANFAGLDVDFAKESDVYMPGMTMTNLILDWVKTHWKCDE
ncbi:uncharacterized protein N7446_010009 [Penicillium canescens]|uniref:uncharacterized protein n=1 Tax=Penicillium canescens TaxID=5083 RepID=UPI0026E082D5|nr:uncharacterized protein N7446_010009 [Penicillium canescens]KAJ6053997.1 hypothetical protein N7446_010009 [Penicillium canescens]